MYVYTTHFAGFPFLIHQWQAFPDIKCSKCSKIADMKPVSFKIQLTRVSHSECAIMTLSHRSTGFLHCISPECHQSSTLCCIIYCKFVQVHLITWVTYHQRYIGNIIASFTVNLQVHLITWVAYHQLLIIYTTKDYLCMSQYLLQFFKGLL